MVTAIADKALEDILSDEEFWQEIRKEVLTAILPLFQELLFGGVEFASAAQVAYKALAYKQVSVAGMVVDEDRLTNELLGFLPEYTDDWWNSIETTTREGMRSAIQASIVAGEPVDKLIPRLEPLFGPARAQRIAVTETTRLFSEGAQRTYQAAGVEYVEWSTVMDPAVCSICMDLQTESRASPWPIGSPAATPPAHVNCRCHLIPVVEDKEVEPREALYGMPTDFTSKEDAMRYGEEMRKRFAGSRQFRLLDEAAGFRTASRAERGVYNGFTEAVEQYVRTGKTEPIYVNFVKTDVTEHAATLLNVIRASPVIKKPIYRGVTSSESAKSVLDTYKIGQAFDLPIASGTFSKNTAQYFADVAGKTPIIFEVQNAQGLPIEALANWAIPRVQNEVLLSGQFRVTSAMQKGNQVIIQITQEGMLE